MLSDDDIDLPNRGHLATVNEGNENALGSYPNTVAEVVSFDSYGVPRDVQHGEISPKLTADEWKFFRKLSKGVKRTRKITKGLIKHIEEHTEKSFTHLCTLCLVNVEGKEPSRWEEALRIVSNSSNAYAHLHAMHASHPGVLALTKKKNNRKDVSFNQSNNSRSVSVVSSSGIVSANGSCFKLRTRNEITRERICQW